MLKEACSLQQGCACGVLPAEHYSEWNPSPCNSLFSSSWHYALVNLVVLKFLQLVVSLEMFSDLGPISPLLQVSVGRPSGKTLLKEESVK